MQRPSFLLSNQRITLTVLGDHASLSCLLSSIPKIGDPEHIRTESNSPSQKRVAEDDDRLIGGAEQSGIKLCSLYMRSLHDGQGTEVWNKLWRSGSESR
ncbi:hypothetical protein YC2023_120307 [Brassica napus]